MFILFFCCEAKKNHFVLRGQRPLLVAKAAQNQPHASFTNNLQRLGIKAGKLATLKQYPPLLFTSPAIIAHSAIVAKISFVYVKIFLDYLE